MSRAGLPESAVGDCRVQFAVVTRPHFSAVCQRTTTDSSFDSYFLSLNFQQQQLPADAANTAKRIKLVLFNNGLGTTETRAARRCTRRVGSIESFGRPEARLEHLSVWCRSPCRPEERCVGISRTSKQAGFCDRPKHLTSEKPKVNTKKQRPASCGGSQFVGLTKPGWEWKKEGWQLVASVRSNEWIRADRQQSTEGRVSWLNNSFLRAPAHRLKPPAHLLLTGQPAVKGRDRGRASPPPKASETQQHADWRQA